MALATPTSPKKIYNKRPVVKRNKFANMTEEIWKSSNEQSKKTRGISNLTYHDIFKD